MKKTVSFSSLLVFFFLFSHFLIRGDTIPTLLPDLLVTKIDAVKFEENEAAIHVRITFTVKNNSRIPIKAGLNPGITTIKTMLTRDWSETEPPAFLSYFECPLLGANESKTFTHEEWIRKEIPHCTYIAFVDADQKIREKNENNNKNKFLFTN